MDCQFHFGLKAPTYDWFWKYGLTYDQAIEKLQYMGVDFIMCHNEHLPGASTAVPASVPPHLSQQFASYDEHIFRDKLRKAGIGYVGQVHYGFNESLMHCHGNVAVDQYGKNSEKIDWYVGVCPTCDAYNDALCGNLERAMRDYAMDGAFLGFMRYPGFWELWLPGTDETKWPEYCFCERCIAKFEAASGIKVPTGAAQTPGQWIHANCREQWVRFKCGVIHDIIGRFRGVVQQYNPQGKIILNTVPFDPAHFGGNGRTLFGQDPSLLADVVDIFEIMGYHQILGLPYQWIGEAGDYFKQITGGRHVCLTAQGKALYTQGMHSGKGRAETINNDEFRRALQTIRDSKADGAIVFTWSDFLSNEYEKHDLTTLEMVHELFAK